MPYTIDRQSLFAGPFAATNDAATSARLSVAGFAGAMLFIESITGASDTITWYVSKTLSSTTAYAAHDAEGNAITTTVEQGKAYALPDALFGAQFVVPVMTGGNASLNIAVKG